MRVTVIVTNYDYGSFVRMAIDSVAAQTHAVSEIIVVDDGSSDNSRAVLQQALSELNDLSVIFQSNQGQAAAMNAGFAASTGDIICMLDADDVWHASKIAAIVDAFTLNPLAGMVQHTLRRVDAEAREIRCQTSAKRLHSGDLFPLLVQTGGANLFEPTSALSFRRSTLAQFMPLPVEEWRLCADGALVFAAAVHSEVLSLDQDLGDYRIHGDNLYAVRTCSSTRLFADLAMTNRYLNEQAARAGRNCLVDLNRQLPFRRERFYTQGGSWREFLTVFSMI